MLLANFKNRLVNKNKIIDIENDTASDFSIMVTYLPKSAQESDIKEFFELEFPGVDVKEISLGYDLGHLKKMEKLKDSLHDKLVNIIYESDQNRHLLHNALVELPMRGQEPQMEAVSQLLAAALNDCKNKKEEYDAIERFMQEHKDNILNNKAKYFTGIAFVSFN